MPLTIAIRWNYQMDSLRDERLSDSRSFSAFQETIEGTKRQIRQLLKCQQSYSAKLAQPKIVAHVNNVQNVEEGYL